jgi:hypothetical protein
MKKTPPIIEVVGEGASISEIAEAAYLNSLFLSVNSQDELLRGLRKWGSPLARLLVRMFTDKTGPGRLIWQRRRGKPQRRDETKLMWEVDASYRRALNPHFDDKPRHVLMKVVMSDLVSQYGLTVPKIKSLLRRAKKARKQLFLD